MESKNKSSKKQNEEKYLRRRLRAILDPCLKAMKKNTKSSGFGKKLQICEHSGATCPEPESNDNTEFIRDYLVIDLAHRRIESEDLPYLGLLGYMGKRSST